MFKSLLNSIATALAVRFRFIVFFRMIRFLHQRKLFPRMASKTINFFDPNNLRRKTERSLTKTLVNQTGVYGEKFSLDLSEHIEFQTFFRGCFDRVAPEIVKKFPKELKINFLDIGANIGLVSLAAGKLGAEVNAFEPLPRNLEILSANFSLNKDLKATIWPLALTSYSATQKSKFLRIFSPEGNSGATSSNSSWNVGKKAPVEAFVEARTLDDCVFHYLVTKKNSVTVIKIDVEGMELSVLIGAKKILNHLSPLVILEWRPDLLSQIDKLELFNFLTSSPHYGVLEVQYSIDQSRLIWSDVNWQKPCENLAFFPIKMKEMLLA